MPAVAPWIVAMVVLVGLGAACVVVLIAMRQRMTQPSEGPAPSGVIEMDCSVCRKKMSFTWRDITRLSGVELALAIRSAPSLSGRPLGEFTCPHCEASHTFALDARTPAWVGANLCIPQGRSAVCAECRKPLATPPWGPGEYDGRISEAPGLGPEHGLVCPFCHSVCCVACCKDATRNRTKDGALVCPRCYRHPVDQVFHP